jgi:predicted dienelactone hydrolase
MKSFSNGIIVGLALVLIGVIGCQSQRGVAPTNVETRRGELREALYNVGYKIYDFSYTLSNGTTKTLTTAIWYPTTDEPKKYNYNRLVVHGRVAVNGKVEKTGTPYPLIVFSHGFAGCGVQSTYITQYLAAKGYIVAAPDHEDASFCGIKGKRKKPPRNDREQSWFESTPNRPSDIKAVIDEMLRLNKNKGSVFYQAINERAIGVSGHSEGGWTAQVVSGAVPSRYKHYRDKRIKAALILAGGVMFLEKEDFRKMNIPVMYILGEKDQGHLFYDELRRNGYDNVNPPKFLLIIKKANHFTFVDAPTCVMSRTVENCQNSNSYAKIILKYGLEFWNRYLKGELSSEKKILSTDPMLYSYEYELR